MPVSHRATEAELRAEQQRRHHIDKLTKTIEKLKGNLSRPELNRKMTEKQIRQKEKRLKRLEERPEKHEAQLQRRKEKRLRADERRRLGEIRGKNRKQVLHDYYNSETWYRIREAYNERGPGNGSCVVCGGRSRLRVHHLIYRKPIGSELLSDLRHVCAQCHELITFLHRDYKFSPYHATCMAMVIVAAPFLTRERFDILVSVCVPSDRQIPMPLHSIEKAAV